jgi:hypothetical protein
VTRPDADLDELYRLPLSEFTAARNELARRLKAEGHAEEADEVKALRKPTVPVWLVNQLAHERQLDVQRLRKAGEALAKGQAAATAGRSSDAFNEARQEEQHALSRLADAAKELAAREKLGAGAADRALATLRAASLTEQGRDLLKRGRLTEELEPPGFEALAGLVGDAPPRRATAPKADKRDALKRAREKLKELRAEEREADAAVRAAERKAERAEKEAESARARAEEASQRRAEGEEEVERLT